MGKLLSWVLLGALAYLAWRLLVVIRRKEERARRAAGEASAPARSEAMVRCDRCGVYLPSSDAIVAGDRHYCCVAHRDGG